jgi:hypothetical protein
MKSYSRLRGAVALALFVILLVPAVSSAEEPDSLEALAEQVKLLEKLLEHLAEQHSQEIERLKEQIAALEEQLAAAREERQQEELEQLLADASEATVEQAIKEQEAEAQREVFVGRQRSLQALNPEMSFLGDVSYDWSDSAVRDQFLLRGAELGFQAALDPYTRFKAFLGAHGEAPVLGEEESEDGHDSMSLGIGEAYMEWVALPFNMRLRVGKFRQQFGTLNRWHIHALPSVDIPFALRDIFGHHGLVGLGVGADWQLPGLWASSNGLTVEIVNADNGNAFAGSHFRDPTVLLRHSGFFDLGENTYFELGLNGVRGPNDEEGDLKTTVASADFNFVWEPINRTKYRNVEVRGEYLHTRFETGDEEYGTVTSDSLYAYLSWKFTRRWIVGLRYDNAELPSPRVTLLNDQPFTEGLREEAWSPFLTYWQSPFVRLRLQYQHASRDFSWPHGPDDDDRLWLQVTFAAGPHKHEAY